MVDCSALKVAHDGAWAYYYTDFPLVRIGADDSIASWRTSVEGARAFAIGENCAVFHGGYWTTGHGERCVLLEFDGDGLVERAELELSLPDGAPITRQASVLGRGPFLHVFEWPTWYRLDARSLRLR